MPAFPQPSESVAVLLTAKESVIAIVMTGCCTDTTAGSSRPKSIYPSLFQPFASACYIFVRHKRGR